MSPRRRARFVFVQKVSQYIAVLAAADVIDELRSSVVKLTVLCGEADEFARERKLRDLALRLMKIG